MDEARQSWAGRSTTAGLAVLCALAAIAAGWLARIEYGAAAFAGMTPTEQIETLRLGTPPSPLSLRGQRDIMLTCHDILMGASGRFQPQTTLTAVSETCAETATKTLQDVPDWALAHYTLALSTPATALSSPALDLGAELERSRQLAPHESWLGRRRLHLALERGIVDTSSPYDAAAEVAALSLSYDGRLYLASQASALPEFRGLVLTVAKTIDPHPRLALYRALNQSDAPAGRVQ